MDSIFGANVFFKSHGLKSFFSNHIVFRNYCEKVIYRCKVCFGICTFSLNTACALLLGREHDKRSQSEVGAKGPGACNKSSASNDKLAMVRSNP